MERTKEGKRPQRVVANLHLNKNSTFLHSRLEILPTPVSMAWYLFLLCNLPTRCFLCTHHKLLSVRKPLMVILSFLLPQVCTMWGLVLLYLLVLVLMVYPHMVDRHFCKPPQALRISHTINLDLDLTIHSTYHTTHLPWRTSLLP